MSNRGGGRGGGGGEKGGGGQFQATRAVYCGCRACANDFEHFRLFLFQVEEIVKSVNIYAEIEIDGKNGFKILPNETVCGNGLFYTKQYYYNGDCFALELPDCLKSAGVLEIVMNFRNKTDIFIHHPGQFLSPNSR